SGTNVHLVLGEAPRVPLGHAGRTARGPLLLPVSARAPGAVRELALAYQDRIAAADDDVSDICHSAGTRRSHHPHRIAVIGTGRASLAAGLGRFADGQPAPGVVIGEQPIRDTPRIAFVFPGQGARWAGTGRELLATSVVFRQRMLDCDRAVRDECGWPLVDKLGAEVPLRDNQIQTLIWAVQVSLAAMWRDCGLTPDVVIGHSMGEIAAATVTGALSIRDAAAVVCRRGALLAELAGSGAMLAVRLGETEVRAAIGDLVDWVTVAVVNSDHSTVLSGDENALAAVAIPLRARGVQCRVLPVSFPSHSPRVDPLRDRLVTALADLRPRRAQLAMRSTVLGREVDGTELDGGYWMANLRQPVRFADAVAAVLADRRRTVFVEISPHPTLVSVLADILASSGNGGCVVPSLCHDTDEAMSMATGLARAYVNGCTLDWNRVSGGGSYVPLPAYPWQRAHYWVDQTATAPVARTLTAAPPVPAVVVPPIKDLTKQFVTLVATLLGVTVSDVDTAVPLVMLGVDSLLALTLRDRVRRDLGVELSVGDLIGARSVADLAVQVSGRQINAL
ncbi:MAG TPA: acyltransferase domain-containing protein, partial [Pseudonocardiaceae bacterium]|nr:acyltransferase domain-containing protein [Pseudonocardiaceae bacterium]